MPKFFGRFSTSDCKTQAQLCMGRIRLMRNKKQIAMAQTRKEVAELLRANKQENARIRVESVIRDINMLQAYDVLEIFLEMLVQRLQLIDKCKDVPTDMFESLASLIYSASRVQDFPELGKIRDMLGRKFGQEFVEKCSADSTCRQFMVNENLIQFLAINAPDPDLKLQVLSDIAQQHDVEWDSHRAHQEMLSGGYKNFGGRPASLGPPPSGGPPGGPGSFSGPPGGPGGFQGPPGNFGNGGGGSGGGGGGMGIVQPPSPLFQPPPTEFSGPPAQNQPSESKFQKNLKRVVTLGRKSQGGSEEWTDASSAAAAAREYSQNAQKAAEAAQRYANPEGGCTSVQPSQGSNSEMIPPKLPQYQATSPAAPQYPSLAQRPADSQQPPQGPPGGAHFPGKGPPDFNPMTKSLQQSPGNESQSSKQSPLPPGQYRQRSDEDIQRAYDAAGGPPAKKGAPSAPPPQPNLDDTVGSLPSPPEATLKKGGGSGGIDDDLAARFEALKKG